MKTYSAKPTDVKREWYLVDASEVPLGRLSTVVASLLLGKGKPMFTHHIDVGDFVIVINSDQLVVTGNKMNDKMYYKHSGYPGGLRERTLTEQMEKNSTNAVRHSIRGMLPVNKLRPARLERLKIYTGSEHGHGGQQPKKLSLKREGVKK